jgi:hypothetical protein
MTSVQGTYREGKVELTEVPAGIHGPTPVIVTFLNGGPVDLHALGLDETQAAELRARLGTFAEDWNSPGMDAYDDYDAAKSKL